MQRAGSRSWRLNFDVPEGLHLALFIRDAVGLGERISGPTIPPRLQDGAPDHWSRLAEEDLNRAAADWESWWSALLRHPAQTGAAELGSGAVSDIARDLEPVARDWFYAHRAPYIPPSLSPDDGLRNWEVTRNAAEAAARELSVDPGELDVHSWLVLVDGPWKLATTPGVVFYSPTVQRDETQLFELLRDAFIASV